MNGNRKAGRPNRFTKRFATQAPAGPIQLPTSAAPEPVSKGPRSCVWNESSASNSTSATAPNTTSVPSRNARTTTAESLPPGFNGDFDFFKAVASVKSRPSVIFTVQLFEYYTI